MLDIFALAHLEMFNTVKHSKENKSFFVSRCKNDNERWTSYISNSIGFKIDIGEIEMLKFEDYKREIVTKR